MAQVLCEDLEPDFCVPGRDDVVSSRNEFGQPFGPYKAARYPPESEDGVGDVWGVSN